MAVTKKSDIIIPEVMGEAINAKIDALAKFTPYAKVDKTLVGVPGDTVTVPAWNYIGDAEDVGEGESVTPTKLTASETKFTIKKAMKSVSITQEAINSGHGNPVGQAETQLAKATASKVDKDVVEASYGAHTIVDKSANVIGYNAIVDAVTKFADEEDDVEKTMFIHPEQEATLLKDSNFISADKFESGVAVRASIGKIAGCWIRKSKKVRKVEGVTGVQGVYTITIGTKAKANDALTVNGVKIVAGSSDWDLTTDTTAGNATAIQTFLNASEDERLTPYTWTVASNVVTATEKSGKYGAGKPTISVDLGVSGTLVATVAETTKGVKPVTAHYLCPILKNEPDSPETEYTEDEAPALTIFLKADTKVDAEWFPKSQTHDITSVKYYGVALTNDAKVVLAMYGVPA